MISFSAPALCQGDDEELMIQLGSIIFPDCIRRWPGENGLRIWVEGVPTDPAVAADAVARFQTVLGVLRTWRSEAGELVDESRGGLGGGCVRDVAGNQLIMVGSAIAYRIAGNEIEDLASHSARGIAASQNLRNALWLNGRSNRTAADFYMIHEYACHEFDGKAGIAKTLGLSNKSQDRLTQSANNLSPLLGGRHATLVGMVPMTLQAQADYIADLLRRWINQYGRGPAGRPDLSKRQE